jgi:hypothetical protein
MTSVSDVLSTPQSDLFRDRLNALFQWAGAPDLAFRKNFAVREQFDFDDFLYGFEPAPFDSRERPEVVVAVLAPALTEIYGFDPVYLGPFEKSRYQTFIERQLGESYADKLSLVAESMVWFSLDGRWAAYGSRGSEMVMLGTDGDGLDQE